MPNWKNWISTKKLSSGLQRSLNFLPDIPEVVNVMNHHSNKTPHPNHLNSSGAYLSNYQWKRFLSPNKSYHQIFNVSYWTWSLRSPPSSWIEISEEECEACNQIPYSLKENKFLLINKRKCKQVQHQSSACLCIYFRESFPYDTQVISQ